MLIKYLIILTGMVILNGCAVSTLSPRDVIADAQSAREHNLRGNEHFSLGQYDLAIASYRKAIELSKHYFEIGNDSYEDSIHR